MIRIGEKTARKVCSGSMQHFPGGEKTKGESGKRPRTFTGMAV